MAGRRVSSTQTRRSAIAAKPFVWFRGNYFHPFICGTYYWVGKLYLDNCLSLGGCILDKLSSLSQKTQLAFVHWLDLWRLCDSLLSLKVRVYRLVSNHGIPTIIVIAISLSKMVSVIVLEPKTTNRSTNLPAWTRLKRCITSSITRISYTKAGVNFRLCSYAWISLGFIVSCSSALLTVKLRPWLAKSDHLHDPMVHVKTVHVVCKSVPSWDLAGGRCMGIVGAWAIVSSWCCKNILGKWSRQHISWVWRNSPRCSIHWMVTGYGG